MAGGLGRAGDRDERLEMAVASDEGEQDAHVPILAFVTAGWVLATTVAAGAARVISRRWQEGPSREGYLGAVIVTGWL
jgi:hypothetical protein